MYNQELGWLQYIFYSKLNVTECTIQYLEGEGIKNAVPRGDLIGKYSIWQIIAYTIKC